MEYKKLWVASGVNKEIKPFVTLTLGDKPLSQFTPDEARDFAANIITAAEAAEQDAFMVDFVKNVVKAKDNAAANILNDLRQYRETYKQKIIEGQNRKNA